MKPIKPVFPDENLYKYLATVGVGVDILNLCCVEKATVVGIDTTESVTIQFEGKEYSNIPVWIHTDIGTRGPKISNGLSDPENCFKNAALMFPFAGAVVYVLAYKDPNTGAQEILCVFNISTNIAGAAHPTYKIYALNSIEVRRLGDGVYCELALFDLIEDKVAEIPTYAGGVPGLPFKDAEAVGRFIASPVDGRSITDFPVESDVYAFMNRGIKLLNEVSEYTNSTSISTGDDIQHPSYCWYCAGDDPPCEMTSNTHTIFDNGVEINIDRVCSFQGGDGSADVHFYSEYGTVTVDGKTFTGGFSGANSDGSGVYLKRVSSLFFDIPENLLFQPKGLVNFSLFKYEPGNSLDAKCYATGGCVVPPGSLLTSYTAWDGVKDRIEELHSIYGDGCDYKASTTAMYIVPYDLREDLLRLT